MTAMSGACGHRRADGEHQQAGEQDTLAAEAVTHRTGGDDQAGEQHDVGVDDPQQLCR
jgi:hypothetical protein